MHFTTDKQGLLNYKGLLKLDNYRDMLSPHLSGKCVDSIERMVTDKHEVVGLGIRKWFWLEISAGFMMVWKHY